MDATAQIYPTARTEPSVSSSAAAGALNLDALLIRITRPTVFFFHPYSDEQLGLVYVATAASKQGFNVRVQDEPLTLGKLIGALKRHRPPVVGFYVDHENIFATFSAMRKLRALFPALIMVTGGPQSKEWHRRILEDSPCDVAVRGEGEGPFPKLLAFYLRGEGRLEDIPGITWRSSRGIRANDMGELIDLDLYPIPDRSLSIRRSRGTENIVTGRGCPFRCSFCYEGRPEAKYRARSLDNVMAEIEFLVMERRARFVAILDDVFLLNPKRAIEFAARMKELRTRTGRRVGWFCEARADIIAKRPDMIERCVESGLMRVQIGIETGNQAVLNKYNKSLSLDETIKAVEICHQSGVLSIIGNFIVGGADETPETLQQSIAFAEVLLEAAPGRIDINSTLFTPYPGTPMYLHPEKYGIELLDPECVTGPGDNYPFHKTVGLGKWEIVEGRQNFFRAVQKKMLRQLPTIPIQLAEQHFTAHKTYRLRTRWFDLFSSHFNWYNYIGLPLFNSDVKRFDAVVDNELFDLKPLRTVYLGTTLEGRFVINAGHRRVELGEEASQLMEFCAGKLTTREIMEVLARNGNPMGFNRVRDLLRLFDQDRLMVFSAL